MQAARSEGSWEQLRRSVAYRKWEAKLAFAALCVVGTIDRQPRKFGDNEGVHPSRLVVTTGDPQKAPDHYNRGVHSVGAVYYTQAYVYWDNRKRAEDAKTWIEQQVGGDKLLNGWSDLPSWHWELMFNEASQATQSLCFDESEKHRRIMEASRRGFP